MRNSVGAVLGAFKVRFLKLHYPDRIGHLALDLDCYLKEQAMAGRRVRPIAALSGRQPANRALLDYWRRYVTFVEDPQVCRVVEAAMRSCPGLVDDLLLYSNVTNCSARAFDVQRRWGARGPLLSLSQRDLERGRAALTQMGVPEGAWTVCIHARSEGYSPADERFHSHRNVDVGSYMLAVDEIVSRGGWCVRMGDATMPPLPPRRGVIDYAVSPFRSDWLDLFLCATCRLFVGCTSGLYVMAAIFGRPSALTNMAPLDCAYSPFLADLSIPRLVAGPDGSVIPIPEAFRSGVSGFRFTEQYTASGITQIANTDIEILELVRQALDQQEGARSSSPEDDALEERFRTHFRDGAYCWPPSSRIGREFLRRYRHLI